MYEKAAGWWKLNINIHTNCHRWSFSIVLPRPTLGLRWDPLQSQNRWHQGPIQHHPLQPGLVRRAEHQPNWGQEELWLDGSQHLLYHLVWWQTLLASLCSTPARLKKKGVDCEQDKCRRQSHQCVHVGRHTSSPKLMISTLTFSFLRRFAIFTSYMEKHCLIKKRSV